MCDGKFYHLQQAKVIARSKRYCTHTVHGTDRQTDRRTCMWEPVILQCESDPVNIDNVYTLTTLTGSVQS